MRIEPSMSRTNVLILGHSYGSQFVDGYNQYAQLFDPKNFEVTTVYLVGEPSEAIRNKTYSEHAIFLNLSRKQIGGLKITAIKKIIQLCRDKKFEIVICHRYKPTFIMLMASLFCKVPVKFFIMHAMGTMKSFSRKLTVAMFARKNTVFAGISDAVRDDMQKDLWLPKKIITLHNMADVNVTAELQFSKEVARERLQLPADAFIFGQVGRLAKEKDQQNLIRAFAKIKKASDNAKLVLMGDGVLKTELELLVLNLGLQKDVIFTGFIEDGFRYMKAFDCYVSTSTKEAFGRAVLEAMVANIEVIATAIGGVPELVGDVGKLIPPADVEALASAMLTSQQASLTQNRGHARALRLFSFEHFHEIFWQLPIMKERGLI